VVKNWRETVILALLVIFMSSWVVTEVVEHEKREIVTAETRAFMLQGPRFTAADGAALEARVEALENANESR